MGCADTCANCFASFIIMKLACFLAYLSVLCLVISLATPVWFTFDYSGNQVGNGGDPGQLAGASGFQGLWSHCYKTNNYVCCGQVSDFSAQTSSSVPDWMKATRALMIISLICGVVSICFIQVFVSFKPSKGLAVCTLVMCIATVTMLVATVITFGAGVNDYAFASSVKMSFSFTLALISAVGYVAVAVLTLFAICCIFAGSAISSADY